MVWTFNVECNICLRFCWGNAWEFINSRAHRVSQFRTTTTMLELITQLSTHGADICLADNDQQRQRSEWWCRCTWQTTDVHMATDKAVITVTMAKVSLDETHAVDFCKWDHTTNDFHSILLCCLVWLLYACDLSFRVHSGIFYSNWASHYWRFWSGRHAWVHFTGLLTERQTRAPFVVPVVPCTLTMRR